MKLDSNPQVCQHTHSQNTVVCFIFFSFIFPRILSWDILLGGLSKSLEFPAEFLPKSLDGEVIVCFLLLEAILASFLFSLELRVFLLSDSILLVVYSLSWFCWTTLKIVVNGIFRFLSSSFFLVCLKAMMLI